MLASLIDTCSFARNVDLFDHFPTAAGLLAQYIPIPLTCVL
jgi:hypothetical protein